MSDNLPHMDYRQHRRARRLVHECCNYDEGNCLLLDDGEPCVCVQSISFSLMCHWFRVAVLPLDGELAAALLCRGSRKRCAVCGAAFVPKSNRGKYCPDCAGRMKKIKAAERKRKQRQRCHALEPFKPAYIKAFFVGVKGYAIHLSFSPGNGVLMRDNTPKSTRTQGGDPIADYIRADTRLPAYLPYPRFLLKMEISQTAKLLYSLLLDRSTLSQKNKWLDDEGRIYIIYPIAEIAEILDKGSTTIKGALNELDTAGLLERERGGFSAPNRLYVKVPRVPQVQFSDQLMAGNPTLIEPENRPTDGQKTDLMMVGKPSPNQTTINNLTESQTKGVSGGPSAPYGRYGNIFLSQTEYDELQAEYPDRLERFIEEMSRYLAANGKSYQNYAAALRIWAGNDKKEAPKKGIPDYSCKEGESL